MKRLYQYVTAILAFLIVGSCAKDALWNQNSEIPASEKGTIVGQLINTDNNQPLKGIKILFERQTGKAGDQTYVDTVSTDTEGKFTYQVPFPNKVRLVVRDTGRYMADTALIEVLAHQAYPLTMHSYPRFGVSQINVQVVDDNKAPFEGVKVGLYERENSTESFSLVEIIATNTEGIVSFTERAFPVQYRVKIEELKVAYELDSLDGKLSTKEAVNLVLKTRPLFGTGDLKLISANFLSKRAVKNEKFEYRYKSILENEFSSWEEGEFDLEGLFTLKNKTYPGNIEIRYSTNSKVRFTVQDAPMTLSEPNINVPFEVVINDIEPRYTEPVLTNLKVSTLVLNNGLSVKGPFAITMDNKHNMYIADGYKNQLFMVDAAGNAHVIAGTGATNVDGKTVDGAGDVATFNGLWGVAVDSSGVIYTTDAASSAPGHRIRKIVKNSSDGYTVSTIAGTGSSGGTNGPGVSSTFNRPAGIIFDKTRNSLYVSEWSSARIRKIDLANTNYTVSTLATPANSTLFTMAMSSDYKDMYITANGTTNIFKYNFETNSIGTYQNSGVNNRGLFVAGNKLLATAGNQHLIFYYDLLTNEKTELSSRTSSNDTEGKVIDNVPIMNAEARFFQPFGIYYDAWTGNWYISNNTNSDKNTGSVRIVRSDDI